MSLNNRFLQLVAPLRQVKAFVSPVPTSHTEMHHIHDAFRTLGTLELFAVKPCPDKTGLYDREIVLTFNVASDHSLLDPATPLDAHHTPHATSGATQRRLEDALNRIIALPRIGYLQQFPDYGNGTVHIPFTYRIPNMSRMNRADLISKFNITSSSAESPFCLISNDNTDQQDMEAFRRALRFNMTRFHKFSFTRLRTIDTREWGSVVGGSKDKGKGVSSEFTGFYT